MYFLCLYIKKRITYGEVLADIEDDLDMDTIKDKLSCHNIDVSKFYLIFSIA